MKSADTSDSPEMKWNVWQDNLEKVLDASGGFRNCSDSEVIRIFRELCEKSMAQRMDHDTTMIEQASSSVVFSCEAFEEVTFVQWRLEQSEDGNLNCQPGKHREALEAAPSFVFSKTGALVSIEFSARNGERQMVNLANCRRKVELTVKRNIQTPDMASIDKLPRLKSDPSDYVMANRMCFEYDITAEWDHVRDSVLR